MVQKKWDERAAHYYDGLNFLNSYSNEHDLKILFIGPCESWEYKGNNYYIDIIDAGYYDSEFIYNKLSNNNIPYDLIIYYPYSFIPIDLNLLEFLEKMAFQVSSKSHKRVSIGYYGRDDQDYDDVRLYSYKIDENSQECDLFVDESFEGGWCNRAQFFTGDVLKEHLKLEKQNETGFSKKFGSLSK